MSFGIRHTFRTQHISRKIARNRQQDNKQEETFTDIGNVLNNDNVFESNQNFVNNVLNKSQNRVQISSSSSSSSSNSSSSSSSSSSFSSSSSSSSLYENDTSNINRTSKSKNSNLVSARLNLLKNHNKGVTKSEDHF